MTFKPGDRVRCIDDGGYPALTVGSIYTVVSAKKSLVGFKDVNKCDYYNRRFVLDMPTAMDSSEYEEILAAQSIMDTLTNG